MSSSPDDRAREAVEGFVARVRQDLDVPGQGLVVAVTTALRDVRREHAVGLGRLLSAVRELDAAISLRGILEALAAGSRTEALRSALLLLDGRTLRVFGAFGYPEGQGPMEVQVDADSLLVRAVEGLAPVEVPSTGRESGTLNRPQFLRPSPGHAGRLNPLAVGGNVVAVLYSEGLDAKADGHSTEVWREAIEILVRHAALRLENVTSIKTVEALTR